MVAFGPLARALASGLLGLASPPRCAACDARVSAHVVFCPTCARTVERAPADAPGRFLYGGALAKAITRLKYEDATHLARPLSELLRGAPRLAHVTRIVPVPLHARRLAERGFNQSALLARPLARDWKVPLAVDVLERVRDTERQAELDRAARLTNVSGAFRAVSSLKGDHVLLVDDVSTTGATLRACAAEVERVGAKVSILVLAITL